MPTIIWWVHQNVRYPLVRRDPGDSNIEYARAVSRLILEERYQGELESYLDVYASWKEAQRKQARAEFIAERKPAAASPPRPPGAPRTGSPPRRTLRSRPRLSDEERHQKKLERQRRWRREHLDHARAQGRKHARLHRLKVKKIAA